MKIDQPYCSHCTACEQQECYSPLVCNFNENCEYKDKYMKDLKFGYELGIELLKLCDNYNPSISEKTNKIYDQLYDKYYK